MNGGEEPADDGFGHQLKGWFKRFRFYRDPPDEEKILDWLSAFAPDHRELAARVLDYVVVVGEREIQQGYHAALSGLPGWHRNAGQRQGRWYFVGFGGAGESGPAMLRSFREANNLTSGKFDYLFKSFADLPALKLTAADHVVFVDDFAGTGDQATRLWQVAAELIASEATCYLVLTALTEAAEKAISEHTELQVLSQHKLHTDTLFFHEENHSFSKEEKEIIEGYCAIAEPSAPKGYGGLGVMFILYHKTPNNALPILYANSEKWSGLFPRFLKVAA